MSSSEMHNYVILSMTATILMMRAAMEQKKVLMGNADLSMKLAGILPLKIKG